MRYIVFESMGQYYDSIVMVCDKDLKTVPASGLKAGFGNFTIHEESGGFVFESLPLLRHFFQGARDVFGEGYSTAFNPSYEEKQERYELTHWIYDFLRAHKIKREMEWTGGMNVDMYHKTPDDYTFVCFLRYLNEVDKVEYKRQMEMVEEARKELEEEEKTWKAFYAKRRAEKAAK